MASEKETPKSPFGKRIGRIRLSGRELVNFFRKYSTCGSSITAETERHSFSSVDDMEENLPLLQGKTKVTIRPDSNSKISLTVNFNYCTTVHIGSFGPISEDVEGPFRQKLEADLKSLRTPILWVFTLIPRFVWFALLMGRLIGGYLVPEDQTPPFPNLSLFADYFIVLVLALAASLSIAKPVYYSSRETFLHRNRDKIFVGTFMLLVGVFAKWFFDTYFGLSVK